MKISFDPGKNGFHMPSGLGGRSIVMVSESDKTLAVYNFLKFDNFFWRTPRLCEQTCGVNTFVPIDSWLAFGEDSIWYC